MNLFQSDPSFDNPDAIKAAALDSRPLDLPDSTGSNVIEMTDEVFDAAHRKSQQQTEDDSFFNVGDVLTALMTGAGVAMTGGLSAVQGAGIGLLSGNQSRVDRNKQQTAERVNTQTQYVETAGQLTRNQALLQQARIQNTPNAGMSYQAVLSTLKLAAPTATPQEWQGLVQQLTPMYPFLRYLSQETVASGIVTENVAKNMPEYMEQAARLHELGQTEAANEMLGPIYQNYAQRPMANIFDPSDPEALKMIYSRVVGNSELDSQARQAMLGKLALIKTIDPDNYSNFVTSLSSIPNRGDSLQAAMNARLSYLTESLDIKDGDEKGKLLLQLLKIGIGVAGDPTSQLFMDPQLLSSTNSITHLAVQGILDSLAPNTSTLGTQEPTVEFNTKVNVEEEISKLDEYDQQTVEELIKSATKVVKENPIILSGLASDTNTNWSLIRSQLLKEMPGANKWLDQPKIRDIIVSALAQQGGSNAGTP